MASTKRAVTVQRAMLVVLAVALLTLAVVAGLWAGDRRRDADRSAARVVIADHPLVQAGAQATRNV
jgi:hypothetical protein